MSDDNGKAYVHTGRDVKSVAFTSYASNKIVDTPIITPEYSGALVVFNSLDKLLRNPDEGHNRDKERLIEGLSAEISNSLTDGWVNIYFCSFEKYSDFTRDELPDDFTTIDEDKIYYVKQEKVMAKFINSCLPRMEKVRFVGIITKSELENIASMLGNDEYEIDIEADSPYLVVIDE
jgi:hypothetical protein